MLNLHCHQTRGSCGSHSIRSHLQQITHQKFAPNRSRFPRKTASLQNKSHNRTTWHSAATLNHHKMAVLFAHMQNRKSREQRSVISLKGPYTGLTPIENMLHLYLWPHSPLLKPIIVLNDIQCWFLTSFTASLKKHYQGWSKPGKRLQGRLRRNYKLTWVH